jgi:flagellin-like protein
MVGSTQRGVSSVIGIILLVAVTVIVAATVATFALGIKDNSQDVPPKGAFEFTYQNATDTSSFKPSNPNRGSDNLTVIYTHGDTIPSGRVNITVTGAKERSQNGNVLTTDIVFEPTYKGGGNLFADTEEVTAGDQYTISDEDFVPKNSPSNLGFNSKLDLTAATVRVYWIDDEEENGAVIAKWSGPEA